MFYFLTICYEIHIKLIYVNARWIETTNYRMIYYEMFVRYFLIHVCSNSVKMFCNDIIFCNLWFYACSNMISNRMFQFERNFLTIDLYFAFDWFITYLSFDEMFWQTIYVSQFMISSTCLNFNEIFATTLYFVIYDFVTFIHVQILTKCLYKWFLFRNLWSCLHVEIVLDVW